MDIIGLEVQMRKYTYDAYAVKIKRWRNKLAAIKYLGGRCLKCGLECKEDMVGIFSFHHRNPEEKDFGLASKYDRTSWDKIRAELEKCDLLCNNCHGRIHAPLQNHQQFLDDVFDYQGDLDIWLWGREKSKSERLHKRQNKICLICNNIYEGKLSSKYCSSVCAKMAGRKVKDRPSKEELSIMIDTMSWLAIGRKYGVSDNAVRKWARLYGLL